MDQNIIKIIQCYEYWFIFADIKNVLRKNRMLLIYMRWIDFILFFVNIIKRCQYVKYKYEKIKKIYIFYYKN